MSDIIEKMGDKMPKGLTRFQVLLAADMAIPALYFCIAVKTILFLSLRTVGHAKIFLKISTKRQDGACFSLLYNSTIFAPNQYQC